MRTISPRMAAEFAELVYQVRSANSEGNYRIPTAHLSLSRAFELNLSDGPVLGKTGGVFGLFRETSGFALIGTGKQAFQGHYVIAVRGTATSHDWLTNANVGVSTSVNGSAVHSGFNATFTSMRPVLERLLTPTMKQANVRGLHCVGHSLGGALASLVADWIKARYRKPVNLYTFGAPRVGMAGYSQSASAGINALHRCTHGADPVPNVPLWPFVHAPISEAEYRLDNSRGLSVSAHGMGEDDVPGYRNTANVEAWSQLQRRSESILGAVVRLDYERRHEAFFSGQWADKLSAALITLLKDAGYYSAVLAQAAIGSTLTFYDLLAKTLEKIAAASGRFTEQTKGLLGHMLAFARVAVTTVVDLTFRFIRWVFDQTAGALYRSVRQAIERT
ncbi:MAG: lipase family protein [Alteromonadaceae bacterium]|nr:lipase family protein [Alteromonadaceae bacterium]